MAAKLKKQAKKLAKKGRYGDTHLLHITKAELLSLMGTGKVTRNPHTGLPEAAALSTPGQQFAGYDDNNQPMYNTITADTPIDAGTGAPNVNLPAGYSGWSPSQQSSYVADSNAAYKSPHAGSLWYDTRPGVEMVGSMVLGGELGDIFGGGAAAGDTGGPAVSAPDVGDPTTPNFPGAQGGFPSAIPADPAAGNPDAFGGFPGSSSGDFTSGVPSGSGYTQGPEDIGFPTGTGSDANWWDRLGKIGDYVPSLKTAGNAAQIAGGAYGLYNAYQGRQAQKQQQKQQQSYYDQLQGLMSNPGQVTSLPGYQFNLDQGNQALARRMASMGYGTSGNLAIATQQYGQDYASAALGQQEQLLASQYGRASPPTSTMPDPTKLAFQSLSNLGYGFQ